jgi:uncharacterized protein YbcC (UPF0753/DUF2309 family)
VQAPLPVPKARQSVADRSSSLRHLKHVIDHAAHLLPAQGPITVFIHHNTLHAFEDLPFSEAVAKASKVFGCEPYLKEDRYRAELGRGRIRFNELEEVLREDLQERADEQITPRFTRFQLRRTMLCNQILGGATEQLLWFVAETDALRKLRKEISESERSQIISETRRWTMRDLRDSDTRSQNRWADELLTRFNSREMETWSTVEWESFTLQSMWRLCRLGATHSPSSEPIPAQAVRHRDLLLEATGVDTDLPVNELMIRFCAAFLDQGLSHWPLPHREMGFFRSFTALYRHNISPDGWRHGLAKELERIEKEELDPLSSIHESLELLGISELNWESYISATFLALRGWGGMTRILAERGDRAVLPAPTDSMLEFLAVRLILDRMAITHTAKKQLGFTDPSRGLREYLCDLLPATPPLSVDQRAFTLFQLAQLLGFTPEELSKLTPVQWKLFLEEVETFNSLARRRLFHLAYEHRFYSRALDAIGLHARYKEPTRPRFQALFCIDEREESLRRHLEEIAPDSVTFGTAGFFSVPMYFKGASDAHFTPLCPVIVVPKHWVTEEVREEAAHSHQRKSQARKALGAASLRAHDNSRSFMVAAVLAAAGVVTSIPLVARTLFPRMTSRVKKRVNQFFETTSETRLKLERSHPTPGSQGDQIGFNLEEMIDIGEKVLRDIGLIENFSRLVFILGHGSASVNNPHESAYDCGACGGSRGGPNGRALAQILNDVRVRKNLALRGIPIPIETAFVGGWHNTSNDSISLFDLDLVPETHRDDLKLIQDDFAHACERDARERARRFMSAPLDISNSGALRHVEGRAEDLAQVRPELGHATNAICFVGRRERTRGLFFDRRCFLNSYNPLQEDADATILTRSLQALFPVCSGINLEYYFSHVDCAGYGCGSKLPHNITSLLGVMDGAGSDLRTGLPWQMVEIHEPVRLLFVLETRPETILKVLDQHPSLGRLVRNDWIRLALLDPESSQIQIYKSGRFRLYLPQVDHLPRAASSADWYRGWRDHLEFAEIGKEVSRV